jgi:PAS domain S-box-containing protein
MDSESIRLLLIEDNPLDVRVILSYLAGAWKTSVKVEHAARLSDATSLLANGTFDICLLDLNLPDSSGVETVVRAHGSNPSVPLIVLTNEEGEELALQAVKEGAEDYICKSELEPRLLLRAICYALERAGRRRAEEHFRQEESRYRQLLSAVTMYNYSVTFSSGTPVATNHSLGCLTATGYSPQEYASNPYLWIHMVHPEDRDLVRQYIGQIHAGLPVPPFEHRITRKDGSTRWIRDTIIHRYDEAGRLIGYDGVVEDISERKHAEEALREREVHLAAAQEIQSRLWPNRVPTVAGFDIAGANWPAEFAAGDYFDYVSMLDGSLGLVIGDVSGHGLGPAIVMALTYAHLRSLCQIHDDVAAILAGINRYLISETDLFVTLLFGRLRSGDRMFHWNNAGHPPGYVLDSCGRIKAKMDSDSMPLAVTLDMQFPPGRTVELEPGDTILMLTDGILDARSPDDHSFGLDRTLDAVRANRLLPAAAIIEAIHAAVLEHCGNQQPADDLTSIVVKVKPEGEAMP